jgi:CCR4-NOT transcriptional regulation complex NOT5 subunit
LAVTNPSNPASEAEAPRNSVTICAFVGQVEELEADIEGFQGTQTKKGRSKVDKEKLARLEETLSRHRRHIERLEQMLRLLDNEALEVWPTAS